MCKPFKSGVLVSYSPLALLELRSLVFKNDMSWGLIFPVQVPRAVGSNVGLEHLTSQRGPPY